MWTFAIVVHGRAEHALMAPKVIFLSIQVHLHCTLPISGRAGIQDFRDLILLILLILLNLLNDCEALRALCPGSPFSLRLP